MDDRGKADNRPTLDELRCRLEQEIAHRRRAEMRAVHLNRLLRSTDGVNQLIVREGVRERLIRGSCDLLVETPGYTCAWIVLLDGTGNVSASAQAGRGEIPAQTSELLSGPDLTRCARMALAHPGVVVTEDPARSCPDCPHALRYAGYAGMSVRLEYAGKVYGLLTVMVPPQYVQDDEERVLLQEVAGDLAFALRDIELEEERESATDALRESEDRLAKILLAANDGMWDWDLVTNEVYFDRRYYEMAGYEEGGFPHRLEEFQQRVHPDDLTEVMDEAALHLSGEIDRFNVEFRFRKKDGDWLWVMGRGVIVERDDAGLPLRFVGTHTDVTTRKRVEEALRESEARYRSLIENQGEGIALVDPQERFTFVNPAADRMLGVPVGGLAGRSLMEFLDKDGVATVRAQTELRKRGESSSYELDVVRPDGQRRRLLVTSRPRTGRPGEFVGAFSVFRDVTEQRQMARALDESHQRLLTILDGIDADVYVADMDSHEILFMNAHMRGSFGGHLVGKLCWQEFRNESGVCANCTNEQLLDAAGNPKGPVVCEGQNPVTGNWYINHDRAIKWVDGRIVRLEVATDITEYRRAAEALRESEARNRAMLDALPDMMFVQSRDGTFLDFHAAEADALFVTPEDFLGKRAHQVFPKSSADQFQALVERTLQTGQPQIHEYELPLDGKVRYFEGRLVPYGEEKVLSVIRELTERRLAEQEVTSLARFPSENPNPVLRVSDGGVLLYANEAATSLLAPWDLEVGQFVPDAVRELTNPQRAPRVRSTDSVCGDRTLTVAVTHPPGAGYANVYARDITDRKRAEQALRESERQKELILNSSAEIVVYYGPDLRVVWANRATGVAIGRPAVALYDLHCSDIWRPTATSGRSAQQALEDRAPREGEQETPDGRYWSVRSYPILDDDGRVEALVDFGQDITERKRAEEEREQLLAQIQDQARRIEQILATVPAGVLLVSTSGEILQTNPAAERDLSLLVGDGIGEPISRLGDRPLSELLTTPSTRGLWHVIRGEGRTFEAIAKPVAPAVVPGSAEDGVRPAAHQWVLVLNDVTREREIRTQLQQHERLAAVGQLAAGIAHDFNNIMATIILYAQMASRSPELGERNRERMSVINQQGWHATRLIEQILDFSRRSVLERQPLELVPLLKEQVKLLKRTLPEIIRIETVYGVGAHTIDADPTRIQQMLTNLAVNARDAMLGGGTLRIELERAEVEAGRSPLLPEMEPGRWVCLTVSDTGTGISPDVLPHIFEPFFTTKGPGAGSGLGLAQVHGIVGSHGGRIGVDSQPGEGTTFTIYLPALVAAPEQEPAPEVSGLPVGSGQTILVVEDDAALRAALTDILEQLMYRVIVAAHGGEALTKVAEHPEVALVLSDLVMPEMGGLSLLRAMREISLNVPVVMMSGHPMQGDLEAMQALNLTAWLLKPPSIERLAQLLADALGGRSA